MKSAKPMSCSVLDLARQLIQIDSRNSVPLGSNAPRQADEENMARFLENYLSTRGFAVTRQYIAPRRPNLVAARITNRGWPALAFQAHMDTVGTEGMTIDPFDAVIRDGKLFGRGACDTKGGMAAMLAAIDRISDAKMPLNLLFIATSAEETGCQGAPFMDLKPWPIDGIVVGEPTCNRPVTAHKANGCFELTCRGKAAHGAHPEAGENAIYRALEIADFLRERIIPSFAAHQAPGFAGSTLSVNMINGGTKSNIVPERCALVLDMRIVPGCGTPEETMNRILRQATRKLGFEIEQTWSHCTPALMTSDDSRLLKAVRQGLQACSLESIPQTVSYCTDAGVFSQMGYDCVVLGPGDIRQAHAAVEFVSVEQLEQAVDVYTEIAAAMAKRPPPSNTRA